MRTLKIFFILVITLLTSSCKTDKYPNLKEGMYANIVTDKGNIIAKLHFKETPITVANFVSLAEGTNNDMEEGYKGTPFYDGLTFHRVVDHFMIQGGDPLGTGQGNPGYKFEDEFPVDKTGNFLFTHDGPGVLSMANAGKNTNGSQFFITHNATSHLDGKHTIFGQVVEGQNVVDAIEQDDIIRTVEIIRKGKEAEDFDAPAIFSKHLDDFEARLKRKENRKRARALESEENVKKMAVFISDKKKKAKRLASGLMMYQTKRGSGKRPVTGEVVDIDYAGYFENGRCFQTSVLEVAEKFNLYDEQTDQANGYHPYPILYSKEARLIPGLKEGLLNMNYGDKMLLFIPAYLAYGEEGNTQIPPNTNLVFEVEIKQ